MMNAPTPTVDPDGGSPDHDRRGIVARPRRRIVPASSALSASAASAAGAGFARPSEPTSVYEIGYRKPPKKNQFKKGQSGNPKGRPKGAKSLKTIARRLLTEKINVRTARGENRVTRIEAMMMKLIESASKGDFRSLQCQWSDDPIHRASSIGKAPRPAIFAACTLMWLLQGLYQRLQTEQRPFREWAG